MNVWLLRHWARVLRSIAGLVIAKVPLIATLPAKLLEELTHAAASLPFADRLFITIEPRTGDARTGVVWADGTPWWGVALAHYAPLITGTIAAIAGVVWWVLSGFRGPDTAMEWVAAGVLGAWWALYTMPSRRDRDVDTEASAGDQA